ncbi:hypothetical protein GL50803_0023424 [Giardia duodenalis]|uniref:Uncharacterized protein n=1 Tax=Giardia intestinalis (strain ATCC 50803 / WB clone C6) TaxID=184922 RepID=D3KHG1_GIAIC|nr:hypothetical protein GL50803_0023424 [Giardia intestinalis]KAE8301493.1 hypothetical protein GL50803_0023424 [Giardia intestinalis]
MDTFNSAFGLVEDTLTGILDGLSGDRTGVRLEDYAIRFQEQLMVIYNDILKLSEELRETWRSPAVQTRLKELFLSDAQEDIASGLSEWRKSWELHSVAASKIKAVASLDEFADTE